MKIRLLSILLGAVLSASAWGAQHYNFNHLGVKEGLSGGAVFSVLRDSRGFVWFGTSSGLERYDGYSVYTLRHQANDSTSLPGSAVYDIQELPDGNLMVSTDQGYSLMNRETYSFEYGAKRYMMRIGSRLLQIGTLLVDSQRRTWVYVNGEGLWRVEPDGRTAKLVAANGTMLPNEVASCIVETQGGVIVIYDTGQIYAIDALTLGLRWNTNCPEGSVPQGYHVFRSLLDRDGLLWIYSERGLMVYDTVRREWNDRIGSRWASASDYFIHALAQDAEGRIWVGTDADGVHVYDKHSGEVVVLRHDMMDASTLSHNTVYALYLDREGVMWCGTYKNGVSSCLATPTGQEMFQVDDITTLTVADPGHVWLGTNGHGIMRWNLKEGQPEAWPRGDATGARPIVSLLQSKAGPLYAGTFMGGIYRIDGERVRQWTASPDAPADERLASDNVWAMVEDSDGRIWAGILGGGVQCLDPATGKLTTYDLNDTPLADNSVQSLALSNDGKRLAIGTSANGVGFLDIATGEVTRLPVEHVLPNGYSSPGAIPPSLQGVLQLMFDRRGLLWIAATGGLGVYEEKYNTVRVFNDVMTDAVSIAEDDNGNIWVTSQRSVKHFTPRRVEVDEKKFVPTEWQYDVQTYGENNGMRAGDFNQRAMKCLPDGRIMAGGVYGIDIFDPAVVRQDSVAPDVFFSGIRIQGFYMAGDINESRYVHMTPGQNIIAIQIAADQYAKPSKNRYSYSLEGFSDKWWYLTVGARNLTFTNLLPGEYTLRVKAISEAGQKEGKEAQLRIVIDAPWYATIWAKVAYVVLGLLLLGLLWWLTMVLQRRKYDARYEAGRAKAEDDRQQMQQQFYSRVGSDLRSPLMHILTPVERILYETKDQKLQTQLAGVQKNASQLLKMIDRLLDVRDSQSMELNLASDDIVAHLRRQVANYAVMAERKHLDLTFETAVETFIMDYDAEKVGRVMSALLGNSVRFTDEGGFIKVSVEVGSGLAGVNSERRFIVKVADSGQGVPDDEKYTMFDHFHVAKNLPKDVADAGLGLSIVRDVLLAHGGDVRVLDNDPKGTVFVLLFPIVGEQTTPATGSEQA